MMPKHISTQVVRARLDAGWSPQVIASEQGESLPMLIHLFAVNGEPGLSVRLADAALAGRA